MTEEIIIDKEDKGGKGMSNEIIKDIAYLGVGYFIGLLFMVLVRR